MIQDLAWALTHGSGVERAFLCPVHGDSRPSASVNVLKGAWICYTCGARGTTDTVLSSADHLDLVEDMLARLSQDIAPVLYPESWLNLYDAGDIHPYWLTRFGVPAILHFRLGYDADTISMTYPLRTAGGKVLGVVRRPLEREDGQPKYKYPYGINIGDLLFNYNSDARPVVYLVEGALDAVACWEAGVEAFAIYGSRISEKQIKLIRRTGAHEIVCVFDQDEAGERATEAVREAFGDMFVTRMSWDPALGKDIAELDIATRLDQFGKIRQELIGSETCESPDPLKTWTLRRPVARTRSRTTSTPGLLRIVPTKP